MEYIVIDPNYIISCSELNVSPYLILLGVVTLTLAVLYLGFHLAKEPIGLFIEAYKAEKKQSGKFTALYELFNHILLSLWPIAIVLTLIVFGILFASNAISFILSLLKSGCF